MLKTRTETINEHTVTVTTHPGTSGLVLKNKLIKLLGPSIAKLLAGSGKKLTKDMELDITPDMLGPAIEQLATQLEPEEFLAIVRNMLTCTTIDRKPVTDELFDMYFAGDYPFLYKILFIVLEVNYGNFFGAEGFSAILRPNKKPTPESAQ